jgi:hypothetical protein
MFHLTCLYEKPEPVEKEQKKIEEDAMKFGEALELCRHGETCRPGIGRF